MLRKFSLIIILLAVVFTISGADATLLETWWVGKPIEKFIYVDLLNIPSETIDPLVKPLIGKPYNQNEIDALQNRLLATGDFIEVEFIPARFEGSTDKVLVYIEFVEQKSLGKVVFNGNKIISSEELYSLLTLKIGQRFDVNSLRQETEIIKRAYQRKGYDRVDVLYSYERDAVTDTIVLTFNLTEYEWYLNKPIRSFSYEGLKNVSKDLIDDLTYPYIGKNFTQQLYREVETKLNELLKFSLFQAEAKRTGPTNNDLMLVFKFTELPVINEITFTGNSSIRPKVLEDNLTIKKGEFLSIAAVNASKEELVNLYKKRGYSQVVIDSAYTIDEKSNLLNLTYTIKEAQQAKISEIVFEGNKTLSSSTLRKEISSKVQSLFNSGNYEEAKVTSDIQALQLVYQNRGYIDIEIDDVLVEDLDSDKENVRKLKLTFKINEGEQYFYGGIEVEGNTVYNDQEIRSLLTLKEETVLNISKVQQEISKIADLYWNEGYVENTIDVEEIRDETNHLITYIVKIGERGQAVVEEVIIRGLTKTKPYVLQRELALNANDIFSKEKYIKSAQNLYNTGLLTDVEPSISYGTKENSLVVTYDVKEGNQMNIGFGATFGGNVEGFPVSGFLSWADTNVGGTGRDLEIMTELSPSSQSATISFKDDWVKDKRWSNAINLSFNRTSYKNGRQLGNYSPTTELKNNEAYPLPFQSYQEWKDAGSPTPDAEFLMPYEYLRISLGYNTGYTFMFNAGRLSLGIGPTFTLNRAYFDSSVFTPFDYSITQYGEKWRFSNRLGISATWDGRDLIQNPTKGYVVSQSLTYSGGILGGLSNYMRSSTSASAFLKLFEIPGEKPTPGVISINTTVSFMFDQFFMKDGKWVKGMSASKYEYLYIDGITLARGIT
ncbi:MAG: outer membrane protein assembly factor BamA, partial [Sphaerochaetaceae bacterium]